MSKCLSDKSTDSKSFFLQGDKKYTFAELIEVLETAAGKKAALNQCTWENTFKPTKFGFMQEWLYTQCYINSQGIIHSSRTGKDPAVTEDGSALIEGKKAAFDDFYSAGSFSGMKSHGHSCMKKFLFY